ncbi:MAG TPA: hypothetical protein VHX68_11520, partial [Planctomycetaceae bacterium]|nr:hypothetical protein [Planctomycetaceae bacterium]
MSTQNLTPYRLAPGHERWRDAEHLKLLSIFHFVVGGLCLPGVGFVCAHYLMFHLFFMNPAMWQGKQEAPPR